MHDVKHGMRYSIIIKISQNHYIQKAVNKTSLVTATSISLLISSGIAQFTGLYIYFMTIIVDDKVKKSTDINTCLRLVIQAKIEREGFITLPSDVREGVEVVSDPDLALEKVHKWIEDKKRAGETFQGFS